MTNIKTEWDFSKIYKDINDPKIEKDIKKIDKILSDFAKKYQDKKFIKSSKSLLKALNDYNDTALSCSTIPLWYLHLEQSIDTANNDIQAKMNKFSDEYLKSYKKVLFFDLTISKMDKNLQDKYLKDKILKKYHYLLKTRFEQGKHLLSENEEKILTDKARVAHSSWEDFGSKNRNAQTIKFKGKTLSLPEAMGIKSDLPRKERRDLHKIVMEKYKDISFIAEAELNAVIQNKKIDDELRGFTKPYEGTIIDYRNDKKSIENLVNVVTKNNHISHRFFKLKSKILNTLEKSNDKKITVAELATGLSTVKGAKTKIDFSKSVQIVRDSFNQIDPEFAKILDSYLENGQIDVYPRLGKRGGAFCSPMTGVPTYVMLNHTNKLNDVATLAHEMGHAIHSDLSKTQDPVYQDYPISVAEVASTFFENVLFDNLLEIAKPEEKRDLMITKIQDNIFSIFAQIAYFKYEEKIHDAVNTKGYVSHEELAEMFADCRRSYVGDIMDVTTLDGYAYVYISHFRSFFYVYTYAYGQIISNALYEEYKKDKKIAVKIKKFLSAGGSASPEDIFKSIGIDTTKPDFFLKGLQKIERDLDKVEKLY